MSIRPFHALLAAALLAPAARADGARPEDSPEKLFKRAAYLETQKDDRSEALALYQEIRTRFPDSPFAAQSLARIALLSEGAGDDEATRRARADAGDGLRERIRRRLRERQAGGGDVPAPMPPGSDSPRPRESDRPLLPPPVDGVRPPSIDAPPESLPPELLRRIEQWKKEGLDRAQIRERIREHVASSPKPPPGGDLPPELRERIEKLKQDGRSPEEIRELVRRHLEERVKSLRDRRPAPAGAPRHGLRPPPVPRIPEATRDGEKPIVEKPRRRDI